MQDSHRAIVHRQGLLLSSRPTHTFDQPLPHLLCSIVSSCGDNLSTSRTLVREVARCLDWTHGVRAWQAWQSLRTTVWHESCYAGVRCLGVDASQHCRRPLSRHHGCGGGARAPWRGSCPRTGDGLDAGRPCRGRPRCRRGPQEGAWDVCRRRPLQTVHGGTSPAAAANLWRHAPLGWRGCHSAGRGADAGLRAWYVCRLAGPQATGPRMPGPPMRADEASGPPPLAPSAGRLIGRGRPPL
jgi:hypothetical protein